MANPLFNMFNQQQPRQNQNGNIVQRFQEFVSNFRGDPRQRVQELLDSGSMTPEQFNQYKNIADQLTGKRTR